MKLPPLTTHPPFHFRAFLIFFLLSSLFLFPVSAEWWNLTFPKKAPINVSTPTGTTPAGYQILINVSYDPDMRTDFNDIRFLNGSENTLLPYWCENFSPGAWALFWVRIDQNITNTTNYTIWMYYGNPTAPTLSDGDTTFEFFDDFSGTALNTTKWTPHSTNYTVSDGILRINTGGIERPAPFPFNFQDGYLAETRVRIHPLTPFYGGLIPGVMSSPFTAGGNANADATILYMRDIDSIVVFGYIGRGNVPGYQWVGAINWNAENFIWYHSAISILNTSIHFWRNRLINRTVSVPFWARNLTYIKLGSFLRHAPYDIHDTEYDWIFVRKFHFPEPTSSFGSEITNCSCLDCASCTPRLNDPACSIVFLTANITNHPTTCLAFINISNKIFSCNFNFIDGVGNHTGLFLNASKNFSLVNCSIVEFRVGALIENSTNISFSNNFICNNQWDIYADAPTFGSNNTCAFVHHFRDHNFYLCSKMCPSAHPFHWWFLAILPLFWYLFYFYRHKDEY